MPKAAKKTYRFQDKAPIVDKLREVMRVDGRMMAAIAEDARLSPTTLYNLDYGKTREPRYTTVEKLMRACGMGDEVRWSGSAGALIVRPKNGGASFRLIKRVQ